MKNLLSRLTGITPFIFFPMLVIFRKSKPAFYVFIFLMIMGLNSCFLNYYRTNTKQSVYSNDLNRLKNQDKYFIVHFLNSVNGLEDIRVVGDSLRGKLVLLPNEHIKYLHPPSQEKSRFKKNDKDLVVTEVHLYTNLSKNRDDSVFSERLTVFNRSDVYEINQSATKRNHVLSTVGIIASVVGIIGFVALAITISNDCNCPQLYMDNGGTYSFTSGLYSGAVYAPLERMDYLPLSKLPADIKNVSFKIANAKHEEQFINTVRIMQVNHLPGVHVLTDRHGNIFSYHSTTAPLFVSTGKNEDIKNVLLKTDEQYYSFDNGSNKSGFSDILLSFNKPKNTGNAKLVIHGRNTQWGGLLHKEFINMFGEKFNNWQAKQEKADPKKLEKWQTDQALPLMVYIKTSRGWKFVDYFPLIGNTATRDMIMEINTKEFKEETIELKLETAHRFWDLDFAGIDYSTNEQVIKTFVEPEMAITSDSVDQKNILLNRDKLYTHLQNNEAIYFKYTVPASPKGYVPSYFLVSGGYYHDLEQIKGKTEYSKLYKFRKKGAFDKFSREKYQEAQEVASFVRSIK